MNHLSMLVRGTATLTQLSQTRQYGKVALLLQVLNHFKSYQEIVYRSLYSVLREGLFCNKLYKIGGPLN